MSCHIAGEQPFVSTDGHLRLGSEKDLIWIPVVPLKVCVTLGKSLSLSEPQFPLLYKEDNTIQVMKKIGNNTLNVQYSGSTLLVLSKLMFIFLQSKIFRRMILNFPPLKDQSPTDVCFYLFFFFLFLRKSFILTYRASAVIFALDNKFWKWNKIMLVILRIQFFPQ